MIKSADEFIKLRNSNDQRATHDVADISVWHDVIDRYPEYKVWVILNKTISIEILEFLATDEDITVRCAIARKRKINEKIFNLLKADVDESVRYSLMSNTKLSLDQIIQIKTDDSEWLQGKLEDLKKKSK